jgi:hypothetical protein
LAANISLIVSAQSVQRNRAARKRSLPASRPRRAGVRLITGGVLDTFAHEVDRSKHRIRRLTIVSPWLSFGEASRDPLGRLLHRAEHDGAAIVLITRPSTSEAHGAVVEAVTKLPRSSVVFNRRLHAKLYACEEDRGRGFAVIGSANMTAASSRLDEAALLIRPDRDKTMISDLVATTTGSVCARKRRRRRAATRHSRRA